MIGRMILELAMVSMDDSLSCTILHEQTKSDSIQDDNRLCCHYREKNAKKKQELHFTPVQDMAICECQSSSNPDEILLQSL